MQICARAFNLEGGGGLALLANYKINGSKGTSPIRYSKLQVGYPNVKCKLTAIKTCIY